MSVEEIESKPDVREVASVLQQLSLRGLEKPSVASGYVRGWITGTTPTDIDIQYAGKVPMKQAQRILIEVLDERGVDKTRYDLRGIWNVKEWRGVETPEQYYKLFFINSIDSVYLAADGKLHDTIGFGLSDAREGVLRMNDFTKAKFPYTDEDIVYLCMRGCERVARYGWKPTKQSADLICGETARWGKLSSDRQEFLVRDYILAKFPKVRLSFAQDIYEKFGWGFVFDHVS